MDVRRYLDRIGTDWEPSATPSLEGLATLQGRHLLSVPFENLDVVAGRPIPIDRQAHYAKVVENRRGGFCYELNGLFDWLLGELGFQTRFVEAQVLMDDGFTRRFAHAAILVDLGAAGPPKTGDGWYLADVGFGDFARQPLPLAGASRSDASGTYRVRPTDDGRFDAQIERDDGASMTEAGRWGTRYRFSTDDRDGAAFEPACVWTQRSPDSAFTGRLVCSLATLNGRVTLSDRSLTVTNGGSKSSREVPPAERRQMLRSRFDIAFDGDLTLPGE